MLSEESEGGGNVAYRELGQDVTLHRFRECLHRDVLAMVEADAGVAWDFLASRETSESFEGISVLWAGRAFQRPMSLHARFVLPKSRKKLPGELVLMMARDANHYLFGAWLVTAFWEIPWGFELTLNSSGPFHTDMLTRSAWW